MADPTRAEQPATGSAGGDYTVKVPDVGEGVAEVELVSWAVEVGQTVRRREIVAEVMTDKATVEVPSPVDGRIASLAGGPGDILAVGSVLFTLSVDGDVAVTPVSPPTPAVVTAPSPPEGVQRRPHTTGETPAADRPEVARLEPSNRAMPMRAATARADRPRSTPAVRRRAREAGVDLRLVTGTGPGGRIGHDDLDHHLTDPAPMVAGPRRGAGVRRHGHDDQPIIGMRRRIAEQMVQSASTIPHITYVEEIDVTALEALRAELNQTAEADGRPRLTILPFLVRAIVNQVPHFPMMNAHLIAAEAATGDERTGPDLLRQFAPVHVGIATQTEAGLVVPVLTHAEADTIWSTAQRINDLAESTRDGTVAAADLTGSTITVSSLGRLGGLVSTPIINQPETTIVGVNKIVTRPVWDEATAAFQPRQIMNLSSSFDHRVVDGFDAASFVQAIRRQLEQPALLFVDEASADGGTQR